jgi:LAS superfamily LD-carboxypeptidase LdcB
MLTQPLLTLIASIIIVSGCGGSDLAATRQAALDLPDKATDTVTVVATAETPPAEQEKTIAFLMGRADAEKQFVTVAAQYASREGMVLQSEAYEAFKNMHKAAKNDGIELVIKSANRNFNYQRQIWDGKWTGARKVDGNNLSVTLTDPVQRALKILENSSMPGSSRHHWGTDIDLNAFTNDYFSSGKGQREYAWLQANAARFGFCQPYTAKGEGRNSGYNEERWHWSYQPLSGQYTQQAAAYLKDTMFSDFKGADTATQIGIIKNYVSGINKQCLQ